MSSPANASVATELDDAVLPPAARHLLVIDDAEHLPAATVRYLDDLLNQQPEALHVPPQVRVRRHAMEEQRGRRVVGPGLDERQLGRPHPHVVLQGESIGHRSHGATITGP